jgi:tetratricopeptide (TPR) repeat protein
MKFVCPVCKTTGDIAEDESDQPAIQATCQKCGTVLSIERETGQVQTQSAGRRTSNSRPKYETSSVLSMRPRDKGKKDYVAIAIDSIVLSILIAVGIYFSLNIERSALNKQLQTFSKMVEDVSQYGKTIFDEFQKARQPKSQETRLTKKHVRKGYDHYKANRQKQAIEELSQAIEIDPQNAEAYFWRARAFIRLAGPCIYSTGAI